MRPCLWQKKSFRIAQGSSYGEDEAWNPKVVGIVAGKMANSLGKPCLVLAQADEEEYRGSGRGVPGFDLVKTLALCKEHLLHWGGHPVAVRLKLASSKHRCLHQGFHSGNLRAKWRDLRRSKPSDRSHDFRFRPPTRIT